MAQPPSRPEARSRLGSQTASELGAPVASSIPEQLPGREPALARKGYEDANALLLRYRCVEGSSGRGGAARGESSSVRNDAVGWAELVELARSFSIAAIGIEASGGYERGVMRA